MKHVSDKQVDQWFGYHPPSTPAIAEAHSAVRDRFCDVAHWLNHVLPEGSDKTVALRALREAMYHANACIAVAQAMYEPDPPAVNAAASEPAATFETTTTADGPFVSVSFTSNQPDSLVRLLRDAIRRDDDGTAGVLAKVPA